MATYGLKALINRCGVIAGPGQFGKQDQGVFSMWVAHHYFGKPLKYIGFRGGGKQVRDLLHPLDFCDLLIKQIDRVESWTGDIFNVGGGPAVSVSLREMTDLCREMVGRSVPVDSVEETESIDIPLYVTDHGKVSRSYDWRPRRDARAIVSDLLQWIRSNEEALMPIFDIG